MRAADRYLLGPDLVALVSKMPSPLVDARPVTGLPTSLKSQASFRLRFADGQVLKGRRLTNELEAQRVAALCSLLEPKYFSRVLDRYGCALIEEWVEGTDLVVDEDEPGLLRRLGGCLASIHLTPFAPELRRSEIGVEPKHFLRRLLGDAAGLRELGSISRVEEDKIADFGESRLPDDIATGLIHSDLAPENIVRNKSGQPVVVDNGSIRVDALDYDIARTWYRWPLTGDREGEFLAGYTERRSAEGYKENRSFWRMYVLVQASYFRQLWKTKDSELPVLRLHEFMKKSLDGKLEVSESSTERRRVR